MFRQLTTVFFVNLWTGALRLFYLLDTSGHRKRNFVKPKWAAPVLGNLQICGSFNSSYLRNRQISQPRTYNSSEFHIVWNATMVVRRG